VTDPPASGPAQPAPPHGPWNHVSWAIFGVLLVEFALGMGLNLYVTLPQSPTYTQIFVSVPLLSAHIALGFLLLAASAYFVLLARQSGVEGLLWRAILVLVFVLVALQEGFSFTFTGNAAFSAGMALGFLGAVVVQGSIVFLLRGRAHEGPAAGRSSTP